MRYVFCEVIHSNCSDCIDTMCIFLLEDGTGEVATKSVNYNSRRILTRRYLVLCYAKAVERFDVQRSRS